MMQEDPKMTIQIREVKKDDVAIKIDIPQGEVEKASMMVRCCAGSMILICLSLFYIPFIVLDLWIAYSDDGCVTDSHFMTLKTWLQVCAFVNIGYLTFVSFYLTCFFSLSSTREGQESNLKRKVFLFFVKLMIELFALSWLIVGSVLFWRDVRSCNTFTNDYMYTRLILSYISIFFMAKNGDKNKE